MMKRMTALILAMALTAACTVACGGGAKYALPADFQPRAEIADGTPAYEGRAEASGLHADGYLVSGGVPMLMLGGQLRTDFFMHLEGRTIDELGDYFRLARSLNITMVQVPICWADIEPAKDNYTAEYVEKYIEYAEEYEMKLELLWFGSYMCGVTVEGYVPSYIADDTDTYHALRDHMYDGWIGRTYLLEPGTDALLERETAAMRFMMQKIYEYDRVHGGKHTVVGVQIENEPDMLVDPHAVEYADDPDDVAVALVKHLDMLGRAVTQSDYRCYTRVNLTDRRYLSYFTEHLVPTEGIDFVGLDPYNNQIGTIRSQLNALKVPAGNFAHIAENGGEYTNNDQLELLAITMGCGYEVFEVVTTSDPQLVDWELRGVFNTDFTKKAHTDRLIDANRIYRNGFLDLVLAGEGNVLGFNLTVNGGATISDETLTAGGVSIRHETQERGIAYAAVRDNRVVTVASTKADVFTIGANVVYAEKGYYSLDGVWHTEEVVDVRGGRLEAEAAAVYRLLTE